MKKHTPKLRGLCFVLSLFACHFVSNAQTFVDVAISQPGVEECMNTSLIELNQADMFFSVSPNPAHDKLIISVKGNASERKLKVAFFDQSGKSVYSCKKNVDENQMLEIDVSHLAKGTYAVKIGDSKLQETQMLIIE